MRSGLPLREPPTLNASTRSGTSLRLVARRGTVMVAGRRLIGDSYNGSFVGPTMHLAPGERMRLTLVNRLPVMTNLHFHGMQISPSGSSDNPFIQVMPGTSFVYHLSIPTSHPEGTFWYHDHGMVMQSAKPPDEGSTTTETTTSTNPVSKIVGGVMPGMTTQTTSTSSSSAEPSRIGNDVESQIFAGLGGTIVVGDDRSLLPAPLRHVKVHTLVFKDVQVDRTGTIVQNTPSSSIDSDHATVRLVNGQLRPVLRMRPGETQLWRLANEGADIFYLLQLDGYGVTVVGHDGMAVPHPYSTSVLLVPPGVRYDVLVTAKRRPGSTWLRTLHYSNGPQGDTYPNVPLMRVAVTGRAASGNPSMPKTMPRVPASLAHAHIARHRTIVLSEDPSGTQFYIDGKQFSPTSSVLKHPAVVGTVEQWTILNTSGEVHPFHLHTNHFQVMSLDGVPQPYNGEQDTVPVPYEQNGHPGSAVIRFAVSDYPGRWMFHCHIAAHEDNGMMSYLVVVRSLPKKDQRGAVKRPRRDAGSHSPIAWRSFATLSFRWMLDCPLRTVKSRLA